MMIEYECEWYRGSNIYEQMGWQQWHCNVGYFILVLNGMGSGANPAACFLMMSQSISKQLPLQRHLTSPHYFSFLHYKICSNFVWRLCLQDPVDLYVWSSPIYRNHCTYNMIERVREGTILVFHEESWWVCNCKPVRVTYHIHRWFISQETLTCSLPAFLLIILIII